MKPAIRDAIAPTLMLVAALALWLGVGRPAVAGLPAIRQELAERRGQLESFSVGSSQSDAAHQLQAELEAASSTIAAAGVATGNELELIETLERSAQRRGVAERLQLQEATAAKSSDWTQSKVTLEITGPLAGVAQYLAELRQLPWLITFSSLAVAREASPNVRATLSGQVLWHPR